MLSLLAAYHVVEQNDAAGQPICCVDERCFDHRCGREVQTAGGATTAVLLRFAQHGAAPRYGGHTTYVLQLTEWY
jgi:hypothetical protein